MRRNAIVQKRIITNVVNASGVAISAKRVRSMQTLALNAILLESCLHSVYAQLVTTNRPLKSAPNARRTAGFVKAKIQTALSAVAIERTHLHVHVHLDFSLPKTQSYA
jgi:hypothetical protein